MSDNKVHREGRDSDTNKSDSKAHREGRDSDTNKGDSKVDSEGCDDDTNYDDDQDFYFEYNKGEMCHDDNLEEEHCEITDTVDVVDRILQTKEKESEVLQKPSSPFFGRGWTFLLYPVLVFLSLMSLYCYMFLSTTCFPVEVWCPSPVHTFHTKACCSYLWLHLGASVGMGTECTIDMDNMEKECPMFDCYKNITTGEWNVNGCSYVPDTMFNKAACDIHDLCYITPGAEKDRCDSTFVENIIIVYCDNVNMYERTVCRGRAELAGAVVSGIDSFYDSGEDVRSSCNPTDIHSWTSLLTGLVTLVLVISSAVYLVYRSVGCPPESGGSEILSTDEKETESQMLSDTFENVLEDAEEAVDDDTEGSHEYCEIQSLLSDQLKIRRHSENDSNPLSDNQTSNKDLINATQNI